MAVLAFTAAGCRGLLGPGLVVGPPSSTMQSLVLCPQLKHCPHWVSVHIVCRCPKRPHCLHTMQPLWLVWGLPHMLHAVLQAPGRWPYLPQVLQKGVLQLPAS